MAGIQIRTSAHEEILLPADVCRRAGFAAGDLVATVIEPGSVLLRSAGPAPAVCPPARTSWEELYEIMGERPCC